MQETIIIEAGRSRGRYWLDLWRYRELFWVLAWRDLSVRYKQTAIGVVWALIRPAITIAILTVVFGRLAKMPSEGSAPYAVMVLAGMLPWIFVSTGLSEGSQSLIENPNLITKVYFPRLIMPTATIAVALVDFMISFCLLLALMLWYHFPPGSHLLLLPVFLLLATVVATGPSLWVTALNVKYRDFRYVIPVIVQLGLYLSPVGFSSSVIPHKWRLLYSANPIVGVIDGFRWCIIGSRSRIYAPGMAISIVVSFAFLWLGVWQFRKMESTFADLI
jgi:lipopolysaccharide transport system permease protein